MIPDQYRWNLALIFPSDDAWEEAYRNVDAMFPDAERFRGLLGESAENLLVCLRKRDEVMAALDRIWAYAQLHAAEDATNTHCLSMQARVFGLRSRCEGAFAFVESEVVALDPAMLAVFVAEEPGLELYRHYLDMVGHRRGHVRSSEVEEVLATASEPLSSFRMTWDALHLADLRFGTFRDESGREVQLQQNGQYRYLTSVDRRVRREVWEQYHDSYLEARNTLATNYAGEVKRNVFVARVRGYSSSLDAALHLSHTPRDIYENLLDSFDRNVGVWRRYFRVLARLLEVETLHAWDLSEMPIVMPRRVERQFSFDEGINLVLDALSPLGDEYLGIVRRSVDERWIDVHSNVGKTSGAFSGGGYGLPPFILLNWTDSLTSVSVLAHELGHSAHSYLAWETQPYVYAYYGDVIGETASNINQVLLADHLLRTSDDPDLQIAVILERMSGNLRYLFNMVLLARFELTCHQQVERGDALTADWMIATMADLHERACGDAMIIDRERVGIRWATMSHPFLPFYVYSYGTGTAAAMAIGRQILDEGQPAVDRYLAMLRTGGSDYQHEVIARAGADLRDPATMQAAFDTLSAYVDRLEALVDGGAVP